jgi:hypothetical protein
MQSFGTHISMRRRCRILSFYSSTKCQIVYDFCHRIIHMSDSHSVDVRNYLKDDVCLAVNLTIVRTVHQ